ncbi:mechanosensitive ion channel family protein [Psychrosphaera aestuarii]|uniref:mechanosensitive ion channel family protein n=1 Tax=Psychrosphaera aestuarii TaxID=1266052 RepID=UPI001B341FC4|nr:mechanosensitive ion channel domain-containing protein [Psychrosphaera aestuarii]
MSLFNSQLFFSFLLFLATYLAKIGLIKLINRNSSGGSVNRRLHINTAKNAINMVFIIALLMLWSNELQNFALSIAAFIVAIVLATRELIQCFIGFLYISSTNPFRVGDWIQTNTQFGEVAETDWAKVTLLEINSETYAYTGKTIFLPNNQLMTLPIKNMNYMKRYTNHTFSIVIDGIKVNPYNLIPSLFSKAESYCLEFNDVAERYSKLIENRLGVQIAGPAPGLRVQTTDIGKTAFVFSIFCPTSKAKKIEQALISDFYTLYYQQIDNVEIPTSEVAISEPDTTSKGG